MSRLNTQQSPDDFLVDTKLTPAGQMRCKDAADFLSEKFPNIKYVFCSPYRRTILTMHHIFKNYHREIARDNLILHPMLGDPANIEGDYAFNTTDLAKEFGSSYNFDFLLEYPDPKIWWLYNILEQGDTTVKEELIKVWQEKKCENILMGEIVKHTIDSAAPEDWGKVRARVALCKQKIKE
jgi:hypothetical protein